MVDASLVVNLAELGVLVVGVAVALRQLDDIKQTREIELETRQAALFTQMYDKYGEAEFARNHSAILQWTFNDYDEYFEKYGARTNPEASSQLASVLRFFIGVGVLVDRGLVDVQLVYDLMGDAVILAWERMELVVLGNRERVGSPDHAIAFDKLYKKLKALKP
jgi:hypothetical protein